MGLLVPGQRDTHLRQRLACQRRHAAGGERRGQRGGGAALGRERAPGALQAPRAVPPAQGRHLARAPRQEVLARALRGKPAI